MTTYDQGYGAGRADFWDPEGQFPFHGRPRTAYQRGYAAGWDAGAEEQAEEWADRERMMMSVCRHPTPLCSGDGPCQQR
jgi:hypothetical protein